jgi:hypothetical protein
MKRFIMLFLTICMIGLLQTAAAAAGWSGSQSVTTEPEAIISTTCIEYDFNDWWTANFTVDLHSEYGPAYDLSTTFYIQLGKEIYTTVGVRKPGREHPDRRGLIPYITVTYRF